MMARSTPTAILLALMLATAPARAEDSDSLRYYLSLRFAESNPLTRAHDAFGASIGANLGAHLGFELSLDDYELQLDTSGAGKVGELNVLALMPQVRLRWPLLERRLVPYVLAGAGMAVTQVNDTSVPVSWQGGNTRVRPAGAVAVGIEYFLTDDIAFGTEGRYFIIGDGEFSAAGEETDTSLNAAMWTFGLRLFYPELHPSPPRTWTSHDATRIYLAARVGGALPGASEVFPGTWDDPEQPIFGSALSVLFGGAVGVNLGRYAGVELSIENRELTLHTAGVGDLGEYALFPILLQGRLRYPLLDGRLEPYVLGGAGVELAELNDSSDVPAGLPVSADDQTLVGAIGAGFEYFVTQDISIGWEMKYLISRGHELQIGRGAPVSGNLDALFLSLGVRAYLFEL